MVGKNQWLILSILASGKIATAGDFWQGIRAHHKPIPGIRIPLKSLKQRGLIMAQTKKAKAGNGLHLNMTFYSITADGRTAQESVNYDVAPDVIEKIVAALPGIDRDEHADARHAIIVAERLGRKQREDIWRPARW